MEQKEQSMEEILSSIRKILSTEENGNVKEQTIELTPQMRVDETPRAEETSALVDEGVAQVSMKKMTHLAQVVSEETAEKTTPETSLEGLVRSILAPYLKEWLDANLPALVERVVQKEVRRIADKVELS